MNKKAVTYNVVALIIVAVTILLTAAIGYNLFLKLTDVNSRQFCTVDGLKSQVSNVKDITFFKTYEINCKAQKFLLTETALSKTKPSREALRANGYTKTSLDGAQLVQYNVLQHWTKEVASCWDRTGNKNIFNFDASPLHDEWVITDYLDNKEVVGSIDRVKRKADIFNSNLGIDITKIESEARIASEGKTYNVPGTLCLVCSTTYYDQNTVNAAASALTDGVTLTNHLDKAKWNGRPLLATLREQKGNFPAYPNMPASASSVVYYQYYLNSNHKQSLDRTGIVVLPNNQIADFCDVMANQG